MVNRYQPAYSSISSINNDGLGRKAFFVILILIVYRFGTYIPIPGVNITVIDDIVSEQSRGIIGMFNVLTGGALGRMSIFTLNIMPYITASIIMQLMTVLSSDLNELKKSGESGRKKINQYSKYLSVLLSLSQGYGIAVGIESLSYHDITLVHSPGIYFRIITMITLMGGTSIVIWFADQINSKGIGNGSSMIIFTGIVSGLFPSIISLLEMVRNNTLSIQLLFACCVFFILMVILIVFIEQAQRRLIVHYPRKQIGKKIYSSDSTHLPIKINVSGVIPPIFANALLLFPLTVVGFSSNTSKISKFIETNLSQGSMTYTVLYIFLIVFFCFFYSNTIFNPEETAENLRKGGAVMTGRRPGKQTRDYLEYVLTRLTVLGSFYMLLICTIPEIITNKVHVPFYLGGTSLLIVIGVVLDLSSQVQSHLLGHRYANLVKKNDIMRRR